MSGFIDFISNFIQITGNDTFDGIILAIIGLIAFSYASGLVGIIFDAIGIYDSDLMSDAHWFIRILVFLGLSFICISIAKVINWLCSFQWWVYLIAGIVLVGIIVGIGLLKHHISKKKSKKIVVKLQEEQTSSLPNEERLNQRDICPRCGAPLVKRHGRYGDFFGCHNYSSTGCKYTRRFK